MQKALCNAAAMTLQARTTKTPFLQLTCTGSGTAISNMTASVAAAAAARGLLYFLALFENCAKENFCLGGFACYIFDVFSPP